MPFGVDPQRPLGFSSDQLNRLSVNAWIADLLHTKLYNQNILSVQLHSLKNNPTGFIFLD